MTMEVFTNNKDVLYSRLKQTVDTVAKEKPYGDLTTSDILDALAKLRDDFMVLFARQDLMEDINNGNIF